MYICMYVCMYVLLLMDLVCSTKFSSPVLSWYQVCASFIAIFIVYRLVFSLRHNLVSGIYAEAVILIYRVGQTQLTLYNDEA
jgi:hypothetical protein